VPRQHGREVPERLLTVATWADVGLSLAGAPVGAAIALFGVRLSSRAADRQQRELLASQQEQQRIALEHQLRVAHIEQVLKKRAEAHVLVLQVLDQALAAARAKSEWDSEEVSELRTQLRTVGYLVAVSCDGNVREVYSSFADTMIDWLESRDPELVAQALDVDRINAARREAAIAISVASVRDRTVEGAHDGLGGM
jgi:hypothetical protein